MKSKYQNYTDRMLLEDKPLFDPDFKIYPTYPMDEVFEEFCHEIGQMYGLNDIREAVE